MHAISCTWPANQHTKQGLVGEDMPELAGLLARPLGQGGAHAHAQTRQTACARLRRRSCCLCCGLCPYGLRQRALQPRAHTLHSLH